MQRGVGDKLRPRYVRRGAESSFSVPAYLRATHWSCFAVRADADALSDVVHRYLVEPTQDAEQFALLCPYLLVYFCQIGQTCLEHPHERLFGSFPYREVGTLISVFDRKRNHLAAFVPYIWVDSPLALCAGREIFGYPKGLGSIDVPQAGDAAAPLRLRSWAVPSLGADPLPSAPLITVTPPPQQELDDAPKPAALAAFLERVAQSVQFSRESQQAVAALQRAARSRHAGTALLNMLAEAARGGSAAASDGPSLACAASFIVNDLLRGRLPLVFLKQFRDAENPEQACYQSLIRALLRASQVHAAQLLPSGFTLQVNEMEIPPIARELGIAAGSPIPVEFAFQLQFDFVQDTGRELWSATHGTR